MPKKAKWKATIDVAMVVARTDDLALAIETSNKVQTEAQVTTQDAITLVKDGVLLAQKPEKSTITSHRITLTDNVFVPEFVVMNQGGTIGKDDDGNETYTPPVVGSKNKGVIYELDLYTACYDAAGKITEYEMTTYPNCQGTWISETIEDNVFRVSEYTITSSAEDGQPPYKRVYVKELPEVIDSEDGDEEVQTFSDETGLETI